MTQRLPRASKYNVSDTLRIRLGTDALTSSPYSTQRDECGPIHECYDAMLFDHEATNAETFQTSGLARPAIHGPNAALRASKHVRAAQYKQFATDDPNEYSFNLSRSPVEYPSPKQGHVQSEQVGTCRIDIDQKDDRLLGYRMTHHGRGSQKSLHLVFSDSPVPTMGDGAPVLTISSEEWSQVATAMPSINSVSNVHAAVRNKQPSVTAWSQLATQGDETLSSSEISASLPSVRRGIGRPASTDQPITERSVSDASTRRTWQKAQDDEQLWQAFVFGSSIPSSCQTMGKLTDETALSNGPAETSSGWLSGAVSPINATAVKTFSNPVLNLDSAKRTDEGTRTKTASYRMQRARNQLYAQGPMSTCALFLSSSDGNLHVIDAEGKG